MVIVLSASCQDESEQDSDGNPFENGCAADEVSVSIYGPEEDAEPEEICEPKPAPCEVEEPCGDEACVDGLYALCEAPTLGTSCASFDSETFVVCSQ